jgi:hypothetical protein
MEEDAYDIRRIFQVGMKRAFGAHCAVPNTKSKAANRMNYLRTMTIEVYFLVFVRGDISNEVKKEDI